MKTTKLILFIGTAITMLMNFPGIAQDNDDDMLEMSLEDLMNMEITTSSKKKEKFVESPAVINIMTAEEINDLNFNRLDEVMEYINGITFAVPEANSWRSATIRGNTLGNYNVNTLLLFDGTPIYNAYHGSFDINTIPLSSIKRIEVIKGSNSVLYGTNAINAVINIIPKDSEESHEFSGRVKYGSFRTSVANMSAIVNEGDFKVRLFADVYNTRGELLPYNYQSNGSPFEMRRSLKNNNIAALVNYKDFKFHFQTVNYTVPVVNDNTLDTVRSGSYSLLYPQRTDEFQLVSSLTYDKQLNDQLRLVARSTYQDYFHPQDDKRGTSTHQSYGIYNELELHFQHSARFNNSLGFSYNHYNAWRRTDRISDGSREKSFNVAQDQIPTNDFAIYLNGAYGITSNLKFHYGSRYYSSSYNESTYQDMSPRFALVYNPVKNIGIKAIYGRSFRIPVYFEKASESLSAYGNKNLKNESSISYDLVLTGTSNNIQWDVNFYYMIIDDKVIRRDATDADREAVQNPGVTRIYDNIGNVNYRGAEANVKFNISDEIKGFAGYAYSNAENPNDDPSSPDDDPWFYEHMITLGTVYRPLSWGEFTLSSKSITEWGPSPGYALINLGLNIYPRQDVPFSFNIKVDNVFNEEVYKPETSNRVLMTAPYNPENLSRMWSFGLSYNL